MTNRERRDFLKQLEKAREDFFNWPHVLAMEALQCMERFPKPPDSVNGELIESTLAQIQEFKRRWMALPPFADRITRAVREGMTVAHMPIMQLEQELVDALPAGAIAPVPSTKPCSPEQAISAWNRNAGVPESSDQTFPDHTPMEKDQ